MSKVLTDIQEESDRLVKKSGSGFKVLPPDLKVLADHIQQYADISYYIANTTASQAPNKSGNV
eukprot:CAMPEP_0119033988 /NCGR_PEP_ID=MMETSP1177-20130426/1055_1 /TAXON_ID=2985 /ORGANISM="Ochromonas sp, Strain CCMP1899" /LENGTH=62 /DNA_ID=CAMNT_0006991155 /DNA_START=1533 /DNA_END=1721 /DNA_ORIENTATION=+